MAHQGSGPIRRVLVVEDDPVCRRYTSEALRQAGTTVKQTASLRQAVSVALAWRPQLILTDLHLPDGGGKELLRRVRAGWPARWPPPEFVAMTAADPARLENNLVGCGLSRVLRKPFEPADLAGLLAEPCRGRRKNGAPDDSLRRLARREFRRQLPRVAALLETGRLDAAAALAHRLAASAAMCRATELGQRLQALSETCLNRPLPEELAETFTTARRLARDFAEGVTPGRRSG
jgi:CheY-like chemotaxis protein